MTEQSSTKVEAPEESGAAPAPQVDVVSESAAPDDEAQGAQAGQTSQTSKERQRAEKAAAAVPAPAPAEVPAGVKLPHAMLRYTTLRLGLFLAALVVMWLLAALFGMDLSSQLSKLTLVAVALLISSAGSFILLSKQRDAMSARIVARTERLGRKFDDAASFEDEDEDE